MTTLALPPKATLTFDITNLMVRPTNPYTTQEEALWQRIVGSDPCNERAVRIFERITGKKHDRNYLF